MQFKEAKEKLKALANGRGYSVGYEEVVPWKGKEKTVCYMFIENVGGCKGTTFQECLWKMKDELGILREEEQQFET